MRAQPNSTWSLPPKNLILPNNHVHVWKTNLDLERSCIQSLKLTLSVDEVERAERFHFRQDRERFIVARGLLRSILASYLEEEADQLRFDYSPRGKPALAREFDQDGLRFNLSHAHGLALYAITRGREIGVDLELIRPGVAYEGVAERFFSPREVVALLALPADIQQRAFFTCWTRKEAYIKAKGDGLALPLDRFDVSLIPGQPAILLRTEDDPKEASNWSLQELHPGAGYVAALAVEGHEWRLKCWQRSS